MKNALDSQEQGISAEEMFNSPIKIGTDISMDGGGEQLEICVICRKACPENQPADQEILWVGCEKCEKWYH